MIWAQRDDPDEVIGRLAAWANQRDAVRAMVLTSTRAIPHAHVDEFSDYDVILVVRDIQPFVADRSWIADFGEVLVAYWDPVGLDPNVGDERTGNIVQFTDGSKIDFSLWPVTLLEAIGRLPALPAELDAGYRVLIDKDGLTTALPAPLYRGYIPSRPNEATYQANVAGFFIGVPYVAKCLVRDELLPAKWVLDYDMRDVYLRPMLEWKVECEYGWSVSLGALGKGLKRHLSPALWADLEATYAGAEIEDNWVALFRLIRLYDRVAREVATHLGYAYPDVLARRVAEHARLRQMGKRV